MSDSFADSAPGPLVLLAEDDDTSRHFLAEALRQLGCRVEACADGGAALRLAADRRFDLLLMDCRMPGAGAMQVLGQLRDNPQAASRTTVAIATSAELDDRLHEELRQSGFVAALAKPLSLQALESALAPVLPVPPVATGDATLDDVAALRSSGNTETMRALRSLFDDELRRLMQDLDALARQPTEFGERLHRLLASCGFCGATALARQTASLKRRLADGGVVDDDVLAAFRTAVAATLKGLSSTATPATKSPPTPL